MGSLFLNNINHLIKQSQPEKINELLFQKTFSASSKYDGTNVGKDDKNIKYGRNQTIVTPSYQKCSLDQLEKLNVNLIKENLLNLANIPTDIVERFNIYGELMCNKGMYDYAELKIAGTHQVFGAIIRPVD